MAREEWKTYKNVFDNFTLRTLEKLRGQEHYDELESPISIGKEANIFSARKGEEKIIVKIYRLEACDFNKLYDYIRYDTRFLSLKKQRRKVIFAWTQREFRNLFEARHANVNVPKPIAHRNNVLIEELIGKNRTAPQVRMLKPKNPQEFYDEVALNMKRLFKAGLVHGDLSEFNILNFEEKPVFIDFSQCLTIQSMNAKELLQRDVKNIVRFFSKLGAKCSEEELMKYITKK